ncbi:MAG: 50S ribosomal protein L17 [Simkaniaceae bacterium]|nr:50S ribosomal protein L17 [Simkaniaceae bacterium]
MRHGKNTFKLGREIGHRRCLVANMLKSLISNGQIETTVAKAKILKRHADQMITLAKKNTLASKRRVQSELMLRYNPLSSKEARSVKKGNKSLLNVDRQIIDTLFNDLGKRFENRQGGYTRIVRLNTRIGDGAEKCIIQYIND